MNKPKQYKSLNLKPTDFQLLQELSDLVASRYGKVTNGELVATLIRKELLTLKK